MFWFPGTIVMRVLFLFITATSVVGFLFCQLSKMFHQIPIELVYLISAVWSYQFLFWVTCLWFAKSVSFIKLKMTFFFFTGILYLLLKVDKWAVTKLFCIIFSLVWDKNNIKVSLNAKKKKKKQSILASGKPYKWNLNGFI